MTPVDKYLSFIRTERRYSPRTAEIYADVLERFRAWADVPADDIVKALTLGDIREYQVFLNDKEKLGARTIGQHISVLSGFCTYLVRQGLLESNPVKLVGRPKVPKRLPSFYRESSMEEYFDQTEWIVDPSASLGMTYSQYKDLLSRVVVTLLFSTGIRRSELIGLQIGSVDFGRNVLHVRGKGNKMREIPIISSLSKELSLYLQATESLFGRTRSAEEPLLVTDKGSALYPMAVERIVSAELGKVESIAGRKSPHVLRHTLATELLEKGADLNSIKELLGHSSLAATQVYTHNTIGQLKNVYNNAHPRAKRGGKNGD
ncbi:MAG: tyrosine-type recombinase/integrase [Bacteroidales bacterium]|nr:tyrosine-type recombinase/integrase [Bacteroidales bacterium]